MLAQARPSNAERDGEQGERGVVDPSAVLADLRERRRLAAGRYAEDPLPADANEARRRLEAEIDAHDLARHVVDLEMRGYTILPPGKAAPPDFVERLHDAVVRVSDERAARGTQNSTRYVGLGRTIFHLIAEDRVFEETILNPVVLTLATYLAGYRALLSDTMGVIKTNESNEDLSWHTDNHGRLPLPWPKESVSANVNWILSDYSRENGSLCVVPGSHLWCGEPPPGLSFDDERVHVIEEPAGSVVVWHSNLWHAAVARTAPGRRVTLVTLYRRPYLQVTDAFQLTTTREMIERNPARFSVLMGLLSGSLATVEGADPALSPARCNDLGRWG
jgi:ectoine hydroxylase-related dioxygenase (phytanoyl-CoA dioxygenase family)